MSSPNRRCLAAAAVTFCLAGTASALIVTSEGPMPPPDPALREALGAIGTWGRNAAAVAVADGWVLTTRHQDVPLGDPDDRQVVFDGITYDARASDEDAVVLFDFGDVTVDLRLVPVFDGNGNPAAFASTLRVSTAPITEGTAVTLGGFGPFRGAELSGGKGFAHAGFNNNRNGLRHGTNLITQTGVLGSDDPDAPPGDYDGMAVLVAAFDDLPATTEATVGVGDSGGFWLVGNAAEGYELAGLTHAVESREEDPRLTAFFTQRLLATDARPFAERINTIPEPATAALLAAGLGLLAGGRRRAA